MHTTDIALHAKRRGQSDNQWADVFGLLQLLKDHPFTSIGVEKREGHMLGIVVRPTFLSLILCAVTATPVTDVFSLSTLCAVTR